ncbi:rhomboid family protein [Gloeomargarita lithophora Alchichica-D10]|uniref:Rhomboid family protein n=1 Tax=Gloeomargarita lithophora Alchichica-D10 TaxID=1188229 RepID=A0A1J0AGV2_9CYAN|nr:rhomboid family intramembrane serine protease [Gloeomargarita lithophora]APB35178.1 rhomboid family protein [Gloeomargarita lithophora Alchichica-D10]
MNESDPKFQAKLRQLEVELQGKTAAPAKDSPQKHRGQIRHNLAIPFYLLAIPWGQQFIDQIIFAGRWNFVIIPRQISGLPGIFLSAFSHANFAHLIANSIPFIIFSWLILFQSRKNYGITLGIGWLGGGLLCWLLGPTPVHGLSGVVYTLFGYLLWIGWQEKRLVSLAISLFVLINYGGLVWGVLPQEPQVAWWGHLIGFALGIGTAYYLGKKSTQSAVKE